MKKEVYNRDLLEERDNIATILLPAFIWDYETCHVQIFLCFHDTIVYLIFTAHLAEHLVF